jgi:hypothetical protein
MTFESKKTQTNPHFSLPLPQLSSFTYYPLEVIARLDCDIIVALSLIHERRWIKLAPNYSPFSYKTCSREPCGCNPSEGESSLFPFQICSSSVFSSSEDYETTNKRGAGHPKTAELGGSDQVQGGLIKSGIECDINIRHNLNHSRFYETRTNAIIDYYSQRHTKICTCFRFTLVILENNRFTSWCGIKQSSRQIYECSSCAYDLLNRQVRRLHTTLNRNLLLATLKKINNFFLMFGDEVKCSSQQFVQPILMSKGKN